MRRPPLGWWLLASLLLTVAACSQRSYSVQGRIVGFGDDGQTVLIEHEEIPGLMPAMTMSFRTTTPEALDAFSVRDAVRFTLLLSREQSWIEDLELLPDSAVARHPAGTPPGGLLDAAAPLDRGDPVPLDTLINQDGEAFTLAAFEGQALLLTFIYTRCPLPDYCPLLSRRFQQFQDRLVPRFGTAVHLLSISIDPTYDTPAVLRSYARRYTDDFSTWTFATGTPARIEAVAHAFGVYYQAEEADVIHNLVTVLIGPDGRVRQRWRGNEWPPDAVEAAVARVMDEAARP